MPNISSFLFGIIVMSGFASLSILALDSYKEKLAIALAGPVTWFIILINILTKHIFHFIKFYNIRSLLVCPDGKIRYVSDKKADLLREFYNPTDSGPCYDYPNWDELYQQEQWNVKCWNKEFIAFSTVGNLRYCPKSVWSKYEPVSIEDIKIAILNRKSENN